MPATTLKPVYFIDIKPKLHMADWKVRNSDSAAILVNHNCLFVCLFVCLFFVANEAEMEL